jgi:hypothetical protein
MGSNSLSAHQQSFSIPINHKRTFSEINNNNTNNFSKTELCVAIPWLSSSGGATTALFPHKFAATLMSVPIHFANTAEDGMWQHPQKRRKLDTSGHKNYEVIILNLISFFF